MAIHIMPNQLANILAFCDEQKNERLKVYPGNPRTDQLCAEMVDSDDVVIEAVCCNGVYTLYAQLIKFAEFLGLGEEDLMRYAIASLKSLLDIKPGLQTNKFTLSREYDENRLCQSQY